MDLKDQALQGMTKAALLRRLQTLKKELDESSQKSDAALLDLEVEDECLQAQIQQVEQRLHQLTMDLGSLQGRMSSEYLELKKIEQQKFLLEDYEALLLGCFSLDSAKFFTLSMEDFAHQLGVGELSVEGAVKQSSDHFSFVFQGKMYAFLKGLEGKYYFHGEEVSFLAF